MQERERAIVLLKRVGLEKELHKTPDEMSGGQNQRIAIVRALANRPCLLLADEPTGNLDSKNGKEVFALMREIGEETGVAVVMVTHDDRLASEAQRTLIIEDGYLRIGSRTRRARTGRHYCGSIERLKKRPIRRGAL